MKFNEIITMLEIILPNEHEAYEIGRMAVYAESLRLPCKSMDIDDVEIVEKIEKVDYLVCGKQVGKLYRVFLSGGSIIEIKEDQPGLIVKKVVDKNAQEG